MDTDRWMALLAVAWAPPVLALSWLVEHLHDRASARVERRRLARMLAGPAHARPRPARRYASVEAWLSLAGRERGRPPTAPATPPRPQQRFTAGRQARARRRFDRMRPAVRRSTALALLTRDAAVRLLIREPGWRVEVQTNGEVRCWR